MQLLKRYSLPILSSILMGTSFMPFPPWAIFFCYVPLWLFATGEQSLKHLLIGAWLCQFIFFIITGNWLAFTIKEFGFFPWPLAILGLLGTASFANLHIPISLFIFFMLKKLSSTNRVAPIALQILLPVLFALTIEHYPMIFKWHFGYTWFYAGWSAAQTAEIWGFQFIHTIILFFNLFSLFALQYFLKSTRDFMPKLFHYAWYVPAISSMGILVISFTALQFLGNYLKNRLPAADRTASVLVIQPNIKNSEQRIHSKKSSILKKLFQQTESAMLTRGKPPPTTRRQPHFILWPEGAYPYTIEANILANSSVLQKKVASWQVPLVLAATGEWPDGYTNSIFVLDKNGALVAPPYNKTRLLAFGEYLPGEKWLPIEKWLSYYGRSFKRGTGDYQSVHLNDLYLGFQICYEGLFADFTRNIVRDNWIDILVNVTNDSWFGNWQEPWEHLYMTVPRAIEVRRPLVRSTNAGFSMMISAKGDLQSTFTLNKAESYLWEVPYYSSQRHTIFTSWGYYINPVFLCFSLLFLLLFIFKYYPKA